MRVRDAGDVAFRQTARRLTENILEQSPELLFINGIELADSLEQALFSALRRSSGSSRGWRFHGLLAVVRLALAGIRGLRPGRRVTGRVAVLVRVPIRNAVFLPIGAQLEQRGFGAAVHVGLRPWLHRKGMVDRDLGHQLAASMVPALAAHALAVSRTQFRLDRWLTIAPEARPSNLAAAVRGALPRLALEAAQLDSFVQRFQPVALVAFFEVGPWSRLIPAVGRARGVPTIDLPHAEANDPIGASGLRYDAIAASSPYSADMFRSVGIESDRVHEIGPLRYDTLVTAAAEAGHEVADNPRRIIFASQPVLERVGFSEADRERTYVAALVAAAAVAPSQLVVKPHPNEPLPALVRMVGTTDRPANVSVHVEVEKDLHELLLDKPWLLVTGSSQSVFESAIVGVPAISVNIGPDIPVTHAQEGFCLSASDHAEVRELTRTLLDETVRADALARSSSALRARFGELDGRAAVRAADLIQALVESSRRR